MGRMGWVLFIWLPFDSYQSSWGRWFHLGHPRVSSVYSSAWHLIAPGITGVCTLGWLFWFLFPPCFPCLYLICHSLFLLSFHLLPEQVAEWRAFCCFPVGCFFKLRGFEFDEWKWNESANTHVTDWTRCVKGKWMLVIHLRAISLTQGQTRADSTGIFGSSLCSGKGTGTGRDSLGKFTGLWAGSSSDQWKSLPCPSIPTGACEMHVKNFVKYFSKIIQFIDDKRHSEVKRLLPLAFQPNMFRKKIREPRDITVLLSGQEPLSSRSFCIWK